MYIVFFLFVCFLFVCCFLDCTSKALLTFFDCRGLAYSCVIIEYLEVFLDVYEHSYHHFYNNRINCLMRKRFSVKYTTMMINSFLRQHVDHQLIKLLMITLKLLTSHLCSTDTTTNSSTTITSRCKSKLIKGNMHVCQRCRGNLKTCNGEISSPPFDLTVAHAYQN